MKTLLIRLFVENWHRKLISLILAMVIWMVVSHSMTSTKVIHSVPVRVINLPSEKTIEGMQANGLLNKKIPLSLTGNKTILDELSGKELEVVIDAAGKSSEWIAPISRKNLVCLNPEIDLGKNISRVAHTDVTIKPTTLITEKIPVLVTQPIGEVPKGYQYLDVWPYQLSVTVNGPEEDVKKLKARGIKLVFNLSEISPAELETLQSTKKVGEVDAISFFVPNAWKKVSVPLLSENLIEIDDPQAKDLRIDFSRQDLLPIEASLPVTVFFSPKYGDLLNPENYTIATNHFITKKNGILMIEAPLYAKGVSARFLETVKDMIQVVIIAWPRPGKKKLLWNAQFMYPHELEDQYIDKAMSDSLDESLSVQPHLREDYLRNRFRSYMNRFRLHTLKNGKLNLNIELEGHSISVTPTNYP